VADILDENAIGRQVGHGDVAAAVDAIQTFYNAPPVELQRMGEAARGVLTERFTQAYLCGKFCDALEQALQMAPVTSAEPGSANASAEPLPVGS
jgi:hypothetical protein